VWPEVNSELISSKFAELTSYGLDGRDKEIGLETGTDGCACKALILKL